MSTSQTILKSIYKKTFPKLIYSQIKTKIALEIKFLGTKLCKKMNKKLYKNFALK